MMRVWLRLRWVVAWMFRSEADGRPSLLKFRVTLTLEISEGYDDDLGSDFIRERMSLGFTIVISTSAGTVFFTC